MSGMTITITRGHTPRVPYIGCDEVCMRCDQCAPLMWAVEKWMSGWTIWRMREHLNGQPFVQVCDHYTAIAMLNSSRDQAHLIARGLSRHWATTIEQLANEDYRLVITDKHRGGRDTFVMHVSSESLFASRYLLHAVLSTPSDVFPMVAKSFCTLVKQ